MTTRLILLFLFFIRFTFGQDRYVDFKKSFTNNSKKWQLMSKSKMKKEYLLLEQSMDRKNKIINYLYLTKLKL